jgi:hypothetical protein
MKTIFIIATLVLYAAPAIAGEDDPVHCSIDETSFWTTHDA